MIIATLIAAGHNWQDIREHYTLAQLLLFYEKAIKLKDQEVAKLARSTNLGRALSYKESSKEAIKKLKTLEESGLI